ncbi:hypothetical protein SD37_17755 [Amycolatopsis orientalis]|uniref:Uncharacterized protein n=1 Tax=Amycolatopsis orientalis TaxID=31958 RepID=A0A193BYR2_AMYOR|nr:hypothetical protein SD37_17755 [Amycolatopsis orientalis]
MDSNLDAALERLNTVVSGKLTGEPALEKLQSEAEESSHRTRTRVELALEEAVESDPAFATELQTAIAALKRLSLKDQPASANITIDGDVKAKSSGIAIGGVSGVSVSIGHPSAPERK